MRKLLAFVFCLAFFSVLVFSYQEEEYYGYSYARLNYVKGDVYIQRAEDLGYEEGAVNLPIVQGDKLGAKDGRAEIHFGKKNYLRIDRYTQIDFVRLPQRGDDSVSLNLLSGNIYLRINFMDRERDFEVHTPDGSFYILEEGLYRFEVRDNQETVLFAEEGSVEAAGEERSELVRSGEKLVAANGLFAAGPEYSYASYEDSFTEWNRGRDIYHNRYVKRTYLPSELYEYEAELAYYGRWVYERPYGYVWIPDVYHYTWRPYYQGRWVWYPICGWTWVSYEPWGWCVSHYGRWHWRVGLGWYWIPTRYWGPAWVHWYCGYDYIGWCPLSYYNYPAVIINNRFYGRYYDRYYPVHSRTLTVVRKDQLSARHVSKVALSQSSVTRLGKISLSSRQPNVPSTSNRVSLKNPSAARVLSRSNVRQVSKSYSSGKTVRSPAGGNLARPAKATQRTSGSDKVNKSNMSVSRSSTPERSVGITRKSRISESSTSRSGIKAYPSRTSTDQRATKTYTQMTRSSSKSTSPTPRIRTYSSQSSSVNRSKSFTRYPASSSSSARSRSSGSIKAPSSSSSKRFSYQPKSTFTSPMRQGSFSTPSRSSSRIKSTPPRSISSSSKRVAPSRSSSSSRSLKSPSRTSVSRSTPARSSSSRSSSRSGTTSKVRKK